MQTLNPDKGEPGNQITTSTVARRVGPTPLAPDDGVCNVGVGVVVTGRQAQRESLMRWVIQTDHGHMTQRHPGDRGLPCPQQ